MGPPPTLPMLTPPLFTTPLTLDSSTPLLRPMFTIPQAMSPTTLPLKPRLTCTTPLAMLKQTNNKECRKVSAFEKKIKSGNKKKKKKKKKGGKKKKKKKKKKS